MQLKNEFTVSAPIEEAWSVLLDIPRVGRCLPGARIEPGEQEGIFNGQMKVKLGPVAVSYQGTAVMKEVDEANHTAAIAVDAREKGGQGTASAVITNQLSEIPGGGTRVSVITDMQVTGRQAQFGRGIMEDVAGRMLAQFAKKFEEELNRSPEESAADVSADQDEEEILDLGNVMFASPMVKYGIAAAVTIVVALLVRQLGARSSGPTFNIDLRR